MQLKHRHLLQIMFGLISLTVLWILILQKKQQIASQNRNVLLTEQNRFNEEISAPIQNSIEKISKLEDEFRLLKAVQMSLIPKKPKIRPRCSPGWQEHASRCFSIPTGTKNWADARKDCMSQGGDLAVILDIEDQKFLTNLTFQFKQNNSGEVLHSAWIGLMDSLQEGLFVWVNNKELQLGTTFWKGNNPNNHIAAWDTKLKGQDCAAIVPPTYIGEENWIFNWDDITCVGERHYVCESDAVIS